MRGSKEVLDMLETEVKLVVVVIIDEVLELLFEVEMLTRVLLIGFSVVAFCIVALTRLLSVWLMVILVEFYGHVVSLLGVELELLLVSEVRLVKEFVELSPFCYVVFIYVLLAANGTSFRSVIFEVN